MDHIATLRQVPLFGGLSDTEVAKLRSIMEASLFSSGDILIREGEVGSRFFVITGGRVQFLTHNSCGEEIVLDEAGPGGFFGELSLLTGEPRAARVRALEDVETLSLDRPEFLGFLGEHPQASIEILKVIGRRLSRADALLRQTAARNVNQESDEKLTIGDRIAEGFATFMGSWTFIIGQTGLIILWMIVNAIAWIKHWDPYPFILLNLMLGFQSAYAAPLLMMSQNREAQKDRLSAEIDHQVNTQAELKIGSVMKHLEELERQIYRNHQEHCAILSAITASHAAANGGNGAAPPQGGAPASEAPVLAPLPTAAGAAADPGQLTGIPGLLMKLLRQIPTEPRKRAR
jgi:uncharacterized membrane protein